MALNQVELWRIQLFGRWGSDCFKIYVRSAPLSQLTMLAKETSVQTSLLVARQELQALLKQIKQVEVPNPVVPLKSQPVEALADCENAAELIEPPAVQDDVCYVLNRTSRGKLHRVRHKSHHSQHYLWNMFLFLVLCTQPSRLSDSDRGSRWSPTMLQMFSATQSIRWKARWWFRHQLFIIVFIIRRFASGNVWPHDSTEDSFALDEVWASKTDATLVIPMRLMWPTFCKKDAVLLMPPCHSERVVG